MMGVLKRTVPSVSEDVGKFKPSYMANGIVKWFRHFGEHLGSSSKMLNIELPYDTANSMAKYMPKRTENVFIQRPALECL